MIKPFQSNLVPRLHFGRGTCAELPAVLQSLGVRAPLIVTDKGVGQSGTIEKLLKFLTTAGCAPLVFDRVEPEPPTTCVDETRALLKANGVVDGIVGVGGGSVMDVAKVVAAMGRNDGDISALVGVGKIKHRVLPLVLMPTTAGTGSEATPVAILTNPVTKLKGGVVDRCLLPDVAIVDPALTDSLPPGVTAASGVDAIVHALEGFIATVATPFARGLALEAARHLASALPLVCREPKNAEARDAMALGAHLAGVAFGNSSCCAVHALALPVGGRFHIPHGVLTGGLVAAVMRRNIPACERDLTAFATAAGWGALNGADVASRLETLVAEIGIRDALRRVAVPVSALEPMAREALAIERLMKPNPVALSVEEIVRIFQETLRVEG